MSTSLLEQFSLLEKTTHEILAHIEGWSAEQLSEKEDENNWSANQVIEHLLISEAGTVGYMKKKSASGWDMLEEGNDETTQAGQTLATRLDTNQRLKAPPVLPEPTNGFTLQQLTANWQALRSDLKAFLHTIEPQHYNKLVFRQPAVGMLNITATLEFMTAHIRHHIHQVERIKSKLHQ